MKAENRAKGGETIVKVFNWVRMANSDYLAARSLLIGNMLVQGAMLSNTAIEKYLKGICAQFRAKIPRNHLVLDLYRSVKGLAQMDLALNEGYLRLLQTTYGMRYPDDLKEGFSVALNQMKLLVQLDRSVSDIKKVFVLSPEDNEKVLQNVAIAKDARYQEKNVVANPEQSGTFFSKPSQTFELRIFEKIFLEADFLSPYVNDNGNFDIEAVQVAPDRTLRLGHPCGGKIKPIKHLL
jgi:HEPN domain-containing protein